RSARPCGRRAGGAARRHACGSRPQAHPQSPTITLAITLTRLPPTESCMTKVLVLYYSSYGHVEAMAQAAAEGARSVPGAEVTIKRVPELVPEDVAKAGHYKLDQAAPVASPAELADYDAILFGTPTRYGSMAAQ